MATAQHSIGVALRRFAFLWVVVCSGSSCGGPTRRSSPPTTLPPECVSPVPPENTDPLRPVITLKGSNVLRHPVGTAYVDPGATALDPRDGDITGLITVSGLDRLSTDGTADFLVRYNVRDSRGLDASEVTRLVRVAGSGFARQTKRHFGETSAPMGYWEHLPTSYSDDPAASFPLIVFNHGIGEAPDFEQVDADAYATSPDKLDRLLRRGLSGIIDHGRWDDSRPFVVLSPQRCVNGFDKEDAFVRYALGRYNVDPSRVYMVGFSMGAGNTWNYLFGHSDRLAAAVTISGGGDQSSRAGCVMKDTPTWSFHAADDQTVPVGDTLGTVASILACQPTVPHRVTIYPSGGHLIDIETLELSTLGQGDPRYNLYEPDVYTWLLGFSRP